MVVLGEYLRHQENLTLPDSSMLREVVLLFPNDPEKANGIKALTWQGTGTRVSTHTSPDTAAVRLFHPQTAEGGLLLDATTLYEHPNFLNAVPYDTPVAVIYSPGSTNMLPKKTPSGRLITKLPDNNPGGIIDWTTDKKGPKGEIVIFDGSRDFELVKSAAVKLNWPKKRVKLFINNESGLDAAKVYITTHPTCAVISTEPTLPLFAAEGFGHATTDLSSPMWFYPEPDFVLPNPISPLAIHFSRDQWRGVTNLFQFFGAQYLLGQTFFNNPETTVN